MCKPPLSPIESDLGLGETLLWSGTPRKGIVLRRADLFMVPFSLIWGGFVALWAATILTTPTPVLYKLWGLLFVLVALHLIAGRFFVDAKQRDKTYYGVTDERIIVVSGLFKPNVESLDLRMTESILKDEKSDGSGTIHFGSVPGFSWMNTAGLPTGRQLTPSFEMIPEARTVFDLIRRAQRDAASSRYRS